MLCLLFPRDIVSIIDRLLHQYNTKQVIEQFNKEFEGRLSGSRLFHIPNRQYYQHRRIDGWFDLSRGQGLIHTRSMCTADVCDCEILNLRVPARYVYSGFTQPSNLTIQEDGVL